MGGDEHVAPGLAFVPAYLVLVNAVIHVLTSVRLRTYNPGLHTSVLLFLLAVAEHAAIALYAISRRRKLASALR